MTYVDIGDVGAVLFQRRGMTAVSKDVARTYKNACRVTGLDTFYKFIRSLDNQLVFRRTQVNGNRPTKYKFFFGHGKTVLKDERAAKIHWNAVKAALQKADADGLVPRAMGPYFVPFGLPAQLKDPRFRSKISNLSEVEDFFLRISAMSLLKTDKTFFERVLKQKGNQLTIAGWPEYPFGWVGTQLGFETGDWQKLAKAYYDALIELAKRTCTYTPEKPEPITDTGRTFGRWFQREIINKNRTLISNALFWAPKDLKQGILSGDAFGFIWDAMSGAENIFVTVIERVRVRSGKNTRNLPQIGKPPLRVDMRASYGQPFLKTLAQTLTLMGTEMFAMNDEFIRVFLGMERGQRGPLGTTGGVVEAPAAAAAPAATAATAWTTGQIVTVITAVTGGLSAIVLGLIDASKEDAKAKTAASDAEKAASDAEKAKYETETARFQQQSREEESETAEGGRSLLVPGLAVAGLAAYLLLNRGKK